MSLHTFALLFTLNSVNAITFLNDTSYKICFCVYMCLPLFYANIQYMFRMNSLDITKKFLLIHSSCGDSVFSY